MLPQRICEIVRVRKGTQHRITDAFAHLMKHEPTNLLPGGSSLSYLHRIPTNLMTHQHTGQGVRPTSFMLVFTFDSLYRFSSPPQGVYERHFVVVLYLGGAIRSSTRSLFFLVCGGV